MNRIYRRLNKISEWFSGLDKRTLIVSSIVGVVFILIWVLFFYNVNDVVNTYRSFMEDNLVYQSDKASSDIASIIEDNVNSTVNLSTSMSRFDKNDENIKGMLTSAIKFLNAENAVMLDTEGGIYFNDGTVSTDYDLEKIYSRIDKTKKYTFFDNDEAFLTDVPSFIVAVPIVIEGVIDRYLVTVTAYNTEFVSSELRYKLDHEEFLIDDKGKIIERIDSEGFSQGTDDMNFFDFVEKSVSEEEFNTFLVDYDECMKTEISGFFKTNSDDKSILYCYYPVKKTNGWAIIHCYPESCINDMIYDVTTRLIIIFAVILVLMVVAGFMLVSHFNHERKKMYTLEFYDSLTGIYNRKGFIERAKELLKENSGLPYYVVCFDIINFKMINEIYGHERSDKIIKAVADGCRQAFGINEAYARLSADVFLALLVDDGEAESRTDFIEKFVQEKAKEEYINNQLKGKRGIYYITDYNESVDRMIDKANAARKYVGSKGNEYRCIYTDEMMQEARKIQAIESRMSQALKNGEFKPYLQAKYNMQKNAVSGAEALVRWIKADGTVIPPGDFIPLFEKNGFVEKLDFYILEEICKYIRRMLDENRNVYTVSVNQSRYLMNDPNYVNKVKEILLKYQIPVGLIELELTETVFFYERDRMVKMMNDLKDINVNLSIDDFGSGYSSFNILKDVPFNVLKIDREFLTESVHTEKGKWILKEIVEMAHGLGMSVICEGVETKEQAELLLSIDCHYAQGFLYARPIPLEDFVKKYNTVKH